MTYNLGCNPQSGLLRVWDSPWSTACKLQGDSQTCTQCSPLCPCDQLWSQGHSHMCPRCHRTPWTHITDCSHDLAWLGFHETLAMQELAHMAITTPWMACARAFSCSSRLPVTTQRHASVAAWSRATWGGATGVGPPTCSLHPRFPRDGEAGGRNSTPPAVPTLGCSAGLYWATVQRVLVAQYSPTRPGSSRLGCPW